MIRFVLVFCFVFLAPTAAFAQQFLWTTLKETSTKYVPIENVVDKVLEFYDHYRYHYDGSGFNKVGIFKMLESSPTFKNSNTTGWVNLRKMINDVNELTVVAFKANLGHGSAVLVMCISKENADFITFSNELKQGAIWNYLGDREKFEKWFRTLLN